jgi:hypothetical protein
VWCTPGVSQLPRKGAPPGLLRCPCGRRVLLSCLASEAAANCSPLGECAPPARPTRPGCSPSRRPERSLAAGPPRYGSGVHIEVRHAYQLREAEETGSPKESIAYSLRLVDGCPGSATCFALYEGPGRFYGVVRTSRPCPGGLAAAVRAATPDVPVRANRGHVLVPRPSGSQLSFVDSAFVRAPEPFDIRGAFGAGEADDVVPRFALVRRGSHGLRRSHGYQLSLFSTGFPDVALLAESPDPFGSGQSGNRAALGASYTLLVPDYGHVSMPPSGPAPARTRASRTRLLGRRRSCPAAVRLSGVLHPQKGVHEGVAGLRRWPFPEGGPRRVQPPGAPVRVVTGVGPEAVGVRCR